MDQDAFMKKYNGYVERYEKVSSEAERLQKQKDDQLEKADKISGFMFEIHERGGILESFDEKLWVATIEQVRVHHDGRMVFVFKSGTEVTR